jgi:hypothetical protein
MIWIVLLVLIVGLGIGVVGTLRLVQWKPQRPELANEDASEIRDGDTVTLTGTVRMFGEPLISPLSARTCVLFETYASLYEEQVPDQPRVLTGQLCERGMIPFELETSLGVILVDGSEADLELAPTPVYPRRPEREAKFLREHDKDERLIEQATFEEITIDPEALVSVQGKAIVESPTKIRLVGAPDRPLVIGVPRKAAAM